MYRCIWLEIVKTRVCEFLAWRPYRNGKIVIGFPRHSRNQGLKPVHMHLYSTSIISRAKLGRIRRIDRNAGINLGVVTIISGISTKYSIYAHYVYV